MMNKHSNWYVAPSTIHGRGIFAGQPYQLNDRIDVGINFLFGLIPYVTPKFGSLLNHSWQPNSKLDFHQGKYYLIAQTPIQEGEEITMDYRETPWYILGPGKHYS